MILEIRNSKQEVLTDVTENELNTIIDYIKRGFTEGDIEGDNGETISWGLYHGEVKFEV